MNPQKEISILKIEKQVAELEADWFRRQGGFSTHGRAKYVMPQIAKTTMLFGFLILTFFTLLAFFLTPYIPLSSLIIGTIIILACVFSVYQSYKKGEDYEEDKAKYEERREKMLLEIQKLKHNV